MEDAQKLFSAYFDNDLTDKQFEELATWINSNPTNMAEFVRASCLHSSLHDALQREDIREFLQVESGEGKEIELLASTESIRAMLDEDDEASQRRTKKEAEERAEKKAKEASNRSRMNDLQRRGAKKRPEPIVIPWSVVYTVVGSAAAAIILLVYSLWPEQNAPQLAQTQKAMEVATIIGSYESEWADPELSTSPGTRLREGPLELLSGFVEVVFDNGAKVVFESPASIELLSKEGMKLTQGKLVGNVPHAAIGFSVETPLATIVDLGTEFGVAIGENDSAEVQVFVGKVEAVIQESDSPAHACEYCGLLRHVVMVSLRTYSFGQRPSDSYDQRRWRNSNHQVAY